MKRENEYGVSKSNGEGNYSFGSGFALGVAVGLTSALALTTISRLRGHSVLRIERSIQIGKPVEEVFDAWADFDSLPHLIDSLDEVQQSGNHSTWAMEVGGKRMEWEAELTQNIPNQSLGWKSTSGPKHTGRINFSSIGSDTQVHVVMNYQPTVWARVFSNSMGDNLETFMERALRDFKASLEGKGQETRRHEGRG